MSKIIVIGLAPLPFENEKKSYAPGIRTWQFTLPLVEDGHKVCLVCYRIPFVYEKKMPPVEEKAINKNLKIYYTGEFNNTKLLQNILEDFDPLCIVGVNVYGANISCKFKTRKPVWADLNGYYMAEAQAKAYVYKNNKYLHRFWENEFGILARADKFSTVSDAQRFATIGELATVGRLNYETTGYEFVHTIRSGIENKEYTHNRQVIRGLGVDNDDFVVLWSGGWNVWADVDTLFNGIELAMEVNPKIKFVSTGGKIVGHDEKTYLQFINLINKSKFKDRFIMKGWIPKEDLHNYYFESNVGIISEKYIYEGLLGCRTRILDWFKAGLPPLLNEVCELSKILKENNSGFTFRIGDVQDLRDKILYLADNRDLIKKYGERGKEYCFSYHNFNSTTQSLRKWVKEPINAPDFGKRIKLKSRNVSLIRILSKYKCLK